MTPVQDPRFNANLAGLRGGAALVVVVSHALLFFKIDGLDSAYILPFQTERGWLLAYQVLLTVFNGQAMVTLFFVLSGTVLAMSMEGARGGLAAVPGYWIKRGFRLYPLLVFAAVCAGALQLLVLTPEVFSAGTEWMNGDYKFVAAELPREVLKNAAGHSNRLNSPAWSIKIELLGSLMFPALFALSRRPMPAVITLVLLLGAAVLIAPNYKLGYINVFAVCFFVGALIPRYGARLAALLTQRPALRRVVLWFAVAALLVSHRAVAPDVFISPGVVLMETVAAALIVTLALFESRSSVLSSSVADTLGRLSYSVYLLHVLVLTVLAHLALAWFHPDPLPGYWALVAAGGLLIIGLPITLGLSVLTYTWIERPLQGVGRAIAGWFDRPLLAKMRPV